MFVKAFRWHGGLVLWVAVFVVCAGRFWFLCDDAYISFRYSRNWAQGLGVVFNPGEVPPVEGYSNFLWVAGGAVLEGIGIPIEWALPLVSLLCGVGLLVRIDQVATQLGVSDEGRQVALAAFALCPAAAVWATSGLATMPFAWAFFEWVVCLVVPSSSDVRWRALGIALLLALLRIEGVAWVVVVAVIGGLTRPRASWMRWVAPVAVGVALYALYTAWRVAWFGTWVPNTALVKVELSQWTLLRGLKYLAGFGVVTVVPVLAWMAGLTLLKERVWRVFVGVVAAVGAYGVVVGGDFMPFGRLFVPSLAFTSLLLGRLVSVVAAEVPLRRAMAQAFIALGALPIAGLHPIPDAWLKGLHFRHSDKEFMQEFERWANQRDNAIGFARRGRALKSIAKPGDSVVSGAVGAIGYVSGLEVLDQHGLVTKEVAYRPGPTGPLRTSPGHDKHVPASYFVKYAPRFLFSRTVSGPLAAGKMKDTLIQWGVPPRVQDRYVPDYWEVTASNDDERTFLFAIRRCEDHEDPRVLWDGFAERRRTLNAELRDERLTQAD
ncbi:MAG: hypothetical protein AAGA48_36255 [Myxococcota bacterium]